MEQGFDAAQDALNLYKSQQKPRNMEALIYIVAHRSNEQRQRIKQAYSSQFQREIQDDFRQNLSGNFQEAMVSLFFTPIDYDCYQLYKAMKGLGTNEDTLIEILATRSNERINQLKQYYPNLYKKDLVQQVRSDTSGFFRSILEALLQANRSDNTNPNEQECNIYVQKLYQDQKEKKEILQNTFIEIFTKRSREELAMIARLYFQWYKKTLFELVESLFSGDAKRVLKAIVYALLSPSEYFAYRINKAVKGLGTNDTILIRVLITRDEIDIERIKKYYLQLYKKSLYDTVKSDVSGDYQKLLLELIGN